MDAGTQTALVSAAYGKWIALGAALLGLLAWRWLRKRRANEPERGAEHVQVRCSGCGELHDLSDMEPSQRYPDVIFAMPEDEREERVVAEKDLCALSGNEDEPTRFFLRVAIPFAVQETGRTCHWGVWVEVDEPSFEQVGELWNDADQLNHGPWPGVLANELDGYDGTLGLPGSVRFVDVDQIPEFTFDASATHKLADQARSGVSAHTVSEWQRKLFR